MVRRRTMRRTVLELLVVLGILISGTQTADVVAEADDMAKRIEEESKNVEYQSNAIASEIEAKGRSIDNANQEKKFEEASKHVDDIMDEGVKEVNDKDNFAEKLENEADKRVDELGKAIEETSNHGNGISRKRRTFNAFVKGLGTKKSTSGNSGSKRRMTVSYPAELPTEESAGEMIEDVMNDGEKMVKNGKTSSKDLEHTKTFSGPHDFSDHSNGKAEEEEDARYKVGETVESLSQQQDFDSLQENENKETGKTSLRHGQPNTQPPESQEFGDKDGNEEIDATKQEDTENDSLNFSDEQEVVSTQNDNDNDDENENIENIMVVKQREPTVSFSDQQEDAGNEVTGEDVAVEHVTKSKGEENNGDAVTNDSVHNYYDSNVFHKNDDDNNNSKKKDDSILEQKRPLTEENGKGENEEHDGEVYDVDVYQENSNTSLNATKLDGKGEANSITEDSSAVVPVLRDENDTQTQYSSQQPTISADADQANHKSPMEINFSPSVQLLKPDQKLMNEIEEDHALRMKEKEKKRKAKDLGATRLEQEFNARWRQTSAANDPEMLLRYPSLGKIVGKTVTNQKVSTITPGEVDFLQTEYPDYLQHGTNRRKVELVLRDVIGYKRKIAPKGKAKNIHLRKLLMKN